jgi:hypothetical protein
VPGRNGLTELFDSTIAPEMAVDMYCEGDLQTRGWDEKNGEWRRMRVDTERGKALEGLTGESLCRKREPALSQQAGCGGAHDSLLGGALQCMSSALLRSPQGLVQEGLRSIIGTAAVTAMEERNLAIDQWGGDKRNFQDVDTPAGRNGVTVAVKMVQ